MLPTLCLIADFDDEFVCRQSISHISLLFVALGRDVVENEIRLLDEGSLEVDTLCSVKAELLLKLGSCDLPLNLLLLHCGLLLRVKLLD